MNILLTKIDIKRLLTLVILLVVSVSAFADDVPRQQPFPAELNDIIDVKSERYTTQVKEIPQEVLKAMAEIMPEKQLKMADKGGKWNATDLVGDASLPFRRLIWAVEVKGRYVVHYEMGGRGHSARYLIIGADNKREKKVLWKATSFSIAPDYPAFMAELRNGKLDTDPRSFY